MCLSFFLFTMGFETLSWGWYLFSWKRWFISILRIVTFITSCSCNNKSDCYNEQSSRWCNLWSWQWGRISVRGVKKLVTVFVPRLVWNLNFNFVVSSLANMLFSVWTTFNVDVLEYGVYLTICSDKFQLKLLCQVDKSLILKQEKCTVCVWQLFYVWFVWEGCPWFTI